MQVTRRNFTRGALALAAVVAAEAAIGTLKKVYAVEDFTGHPDRFAMLTDTTKCVGCRACERACNRANDLPPPEKRFADPSVFLEERKPTVGAWTVVNEYPGAVLGSNPVYRKVQCMHCEEPACVSSCLVGALKKTPEGAVIYNENVCIGCRYCMNACPFSMLTYEFDDPIRPAIKKCILCYSKITKEGGVPACASACTVQATIFGKRSDLLQIARKRISDHPESYVNQIYGEHEAGGTSWLYLSALPFEKIGLPANLGRQPFNEFTRDFLLAVPVVLIVWPALLVGIGAMSKRRESLALQEAKETHKEEK